MNKEQKNQSRRTFWENHINRWQQASEMSQTEYCRKNNLAGWSFSNWKNRFIREKSESDSLIELPLSVLSDSNGKTLFEFSISDKGLIIKISPALLTYKGGIEL
ncbi:MAG: hypothetical protein GWP06_18955 [Actinobacteria bacterium]|nr:hypothetical protein [Actinomycetota bacterium]